MFAIIIRVSISPQFWGPQDAVFNKSFSSRKASFAVNGDYPRRSSTISYLIDTSGLSSKDALSISKKSSSDVNGEDPERSFTISYLTDTCGLSFEEVRVHSISQKVKIKSPANPDSVLKLLRRYGFTDAHIHKIIIKWPRVLLACPVNTLSPKLEFFRSIGVPLDVLAQKLSTYPKILGRSLENYIIPLYDYLKNLLESDKRVVRVFLRAPAAFEHSWLELFRISIGSLRERGIPESSIIWLLVDQPSIFTRSAKKLTTYIDKATEMGFDKSKAAFIHAVQTFARMTESTLEQKKEVYRRCGWSESDISSAFMKHPYFLKFSEKKIMDTMDFFVNDLGLQPALVARQPLLLNFNLDRKMKPRCLVARVLKEKGLLKKKYSAYYYFHLSEERFLKRYIVKYQEQVPELLDIYRRRLTVSEMDFSLQEILR